MIILLYSKMKGTEYILSEVMEPHLVVFHMRDSPEKVTAMLTYNVLDGSIYQAPELCNVFAARVVSPAFFFCIFCISPFIVNIIVKNFCLTLCFWDIWFFQSPSKCEHDLVWSAESSLIIAIIALPMSRFGGVASIRVQWYFALFPKLFFVCFLVTYAAGHNYTFRY